MKRLLPLCLALLIQASPVQAQLPDTLSDAGRIYMVTVLPGDEVYSLYGHTAVRVFDRYQGLDITFNYGTFDFSQPGFVWNFAHGEMDYFLSFSSSRRAAQLARVQERTVRQQLLDLGKEHRDSLYAALLRNARPENREYRYDFLFDNCATRPRDLLAEVMGPAVEWDSTTALGLSFRELLDPYHAGKPEVDLGTDLVMGARLDQVATASEEAFLPLRLEEILRGAWVDDDYGRRPLVLVEDTLIWSPHPAFPEPAFPWMTVLTGLLAALGIAASVRIGARVSFMDRTLLVALGLVGCFLLYMATMTAHEVTDRNWNLLWALPTHLVAAFLLDRVPRRAAAIYLLLSALLAAVSLTGGFLLPQPVPTAAVPIVIFAALRCFQLGLAARSKQPGDD